MFVYLYWWVEEKAEARRRPVLIVFLFTFLLRAFRLPDEAEDVEAASCREKGGGKGGAFVLVD